MFDEYEMMNFDSYDVIAETYHLGIEVDEIDDQLLVETVNEILLQFNFNKEADIHIGKFFKTGTLSERGRKVLEGTYMLYYARLSIGVDNDQIFVTSSS